jgi:hypothetical protein
MTTARQLHEKIARPFDLYATAVALPTYLFALGGTFQSRFLRSGWQGREFANNL